MISDKLFIAWNCSDCSKIKSHISRSMFDDSIRGNDGQILTVIHTFSNDATRDILDIFDLEDHCAPVLMTHAGDVFGDVDSIIAYLEHSGLAD